LKLACRGTLLRGPALNCQIHIRQAFEVTTGTAFANLRSTGGRAENWCRESYRNFARGEKHLGADEVGFALRAGAGKSELDTTAMTLSVGQIHDRDIARDEVSHVSASADAVDGNPWGFFLHSRAGGGIVGSFRSMKRVVVSLTVKESLPTEST